MRSGFLAESCVWNGSWPILSWTRRATLSGIESVVYLRLPRPDSKRITPGSLANILMIVLSEKPHKAPVPLLGSVSPAQRYSSAPLQTAFTDSVPLRDVVCNYRSS